MKSVFITRQIPEIATTMLLAQGYAVDTNPDDRMLTQQELIDHLAQKPYDAVLSLLTDRIDRAVYDAAPSVKIYANYASGYDNLDVVEASKRGVTITNAPANQSSVAVAEHTIALMYALLNRIVEADSFVRAGKYIGWTPMNFVGSGIGGKVLGLVGAGKIGGYVANFARAMGLSVIYSDIVQNDHIEKSGAVYCHSLEELLQKADIVSLHAPLLDSTRHLINTERLALMKPTSYLINTSRGPLIDEAALVQALQERRIAGAALDVFEAEPALAPGLVDLPNVILTPHIASASIEARTEMAVLAAQNIIDFLEGRTPQNIVTPH